MQDFIKDRFSFLPTFKHMDWLLFFSASFLVAFGLVTMNSFVGENYFFDKQIIWFSLAVCVFFVTSLIDWSFLKRTNVLMILFAGIVTVLIALLALASTVKGAQSWIQLGLFSIQPTDIAKLVLLLILAKYFSKRHIEIANIRHIIVSGVYAFILFALLALQPDFGGAMIVFILWFGMVLVSGLSKKHLAILFTAGVLIFTLLWNFGFKEYQKHRIISFINPLEDIRGTGYNAYQSTIAVGSGEMFGKGIGYGTQSKLKFLPEYQTDFIFAAFSEEWGFFGVVIFLSVFAILFWRIIRNAFYGYGNFEILYGLGLAILFMSHVFINIGMNVGIMPVTGINLPFVSYGGSHLITSFFALGILVSMRRYHRLAHKDQTKNEFLGI